MPQTMTQAERTAFLAEPRVAILALPEDGRGPLCAPVWYDVLPSGDIRFLTQSSSLGCRLLAEGVRAALTVQRDSPPYAYVSVEGPVVEIAPYDVDADLLPMAVRYLGEEGGRAYAAAARADQGRGSSIKVTLRPARWLSADYAAREA